MTDAALTELLKTLHTGMVDDINTCMIDARESGVDYALTISNLMMLVAHVASTFATFHFDFTEEVFADIMREHYKIAMKGKTPKEPTIN